MALAGHELEVYAKSSTFGTAAPVVGDYVGPPNLCIDGINDLSFGPTREQLDMTDFCSTTGSRERFMGLKDGTISLSGDYESADLGWQEIETAFNGASNATCWIAIAWDGAAGHHVECVIASFEISASVDGKVEISIEANFTNAPAAIAGF